MRRISIALIILALCSFGPTILVAQSPISIPQNPKPSSQEQSMKLLAVGETAPDWQLSDVEGKLHSFSEYRGKVVVMDFWATWCGPCAVMMPRMQKLHEKYKDKGVVVFGVNAWEQGDPVAFVKKRRYSYEQLLKGEAIADAYKVTTLPTVYIIDADGKIIYCHEGLDDKNLSSVIEKYLKASANVRAS